MNDFMQRMKKLAEPKEKGNIIIISGITGAGKNVITDILVEKHNFILIDKYVTRHFRKIE